MSSKQFFREIAKQASATVEAKHLSKSNPASPVAGDSPPVDDAAFEEESPDKKPEQESKRAGLAGLAVFRAADKPPVPSPRLARRSQEDERSKSCSKNEESEKGKLEKVHVH